MAEEQAEREANGKLGPIELKLEGLEDGYRVTVRGDRERVRTQRRAMGSFIGFLKQADRAGWCVPFPLRLLLCFWGRYKKKENT